MWKKYPLSILAIAIGVVVILAALAEKNHMFPIP